MLIPLSPADLPPIPVRATANPTPPNSALPHNRNAGVEVVDFIAGAGNKVIGAFGGGVGMIRGLVQSHPAQGPGLPNSPPPAIVKTDTEKRPQMTGPSPSLAGARIDAPWNGPAAPLSAVIGSPNNTSGDGVFEKQQELPLAVDIPPNSETVTAKPQVASPLVDQGPGFGMLRRSSTVPPGGFGLLGGLSVNVPSFIPIPGQKRSAELEGKMMISISRPESRRSAYSAYDPVLEGDDDHSSNPRPGYAPSYSQPDASGTEDGEESDESSQSEVDEEHLGVKPDTRSIKSFENMLSESRKGSSRKKGKRRSLTDRLAGLGLDVRFSTFFESCITFSHYRHLNPNILRLHPLSFRLFHALHPQYSGSWKQSGPRT